MKKFIALFLIFSLVSLSSNLHAKERRGADILITKKDGQQVSGELIAVKESSLVLKEKESGGDVTVHSGDVKTIKIVRISKVGQWILTGLFLGGVGGYAIGYASESAAGGWKELSGACGALVGLSIGLLCGIAVGVAAGADETIQIEGLYQESIELALEKLRKKARIPNYQ